MSHVFGSGTFAANTQAGSSLWTWSWAQGWGVEPHPYVTAQGYHWFEEPGTGVRPADGEMQPVLDSGMASRTIRLILLFLELLHGEKGVIAMQHFAKAPKKVRNHHYAESEGGMWDSDDDVLLDPKVIEPSMSVASPQSEAGWGFHARAERLNGRLAMLGFLVGVILELMTGQGILHQIGLSALLHQP